MISRLYDVTVREITISPEEVTKAVSEYVNKHHEPPVVSSPADVDFQLVTDGKTVEVRGAIIRIEYKKNQE